MDLAHAPLAYNALATYTQYNMEDIMESFTKINSLLQSVESKMAAAATSLVKSQFLPAIADVLSKMERIVAAASQDNVQSESGYDSSSSLEETA